MPIPTQQPHEAKRGNPAGTYFAIGTMAVLLVLVGIYLMTSHLRELDKSPVLNNEPSVAERIENPAVSR